MEEYSPDEFMLMMDAYSQIHAAKTDESEEIGAELF